MGAETLPRYDLLDLPFVPMESSIGRVLLPNIEQYLTPRNVLVGAVLTAGIAITAVVASRFTNNHEHHTAPLSQEPVTFPTGIPLEHA